MPAQQNKWSDDGTTVDGETVDEAYHRITGVILDLKEAVTEEDHGDYFVYHMPTGVIVTHAYDGWHLVYGGPRYWIGDATRPYAFNTGTRIIAHVCNDAGGWGAGFVGALSARWPQPEATYRACKKKLGTVTYAIVGPDLLVCNMIAQHGFAQRFPVVADVPLRYDALEQCLDRLAERVLTVEHDATVHMPRIGCGLAGGTWDKVEPIIRRALTDKGVNVTVYDLPSEETHR